MLSIVGVGMAGTVTLSGLILTGNSQGGSLVNLTGVDSQGGPLVTVNSGSLTVNHSTLANNTYSGNGGELPHTTRGIMHFCTTHHITAHYLTCNVRWDQVFNNVS